MNLDTGPGVLGTAVFIITVTFMAIAIINVLPRFWGRKLRSAVIIIPAASAKRIPQRDTVLLGPARSESSDPYAYMAAGTSYLP